MTKTKIRFYTLANKGDRLDRYEKRSLKDSRPDAGWDTYYDMDRNTLWFECELRSVPCVGWTITSGPKDYKWDWEPSVKSIKVDLYTEIVEVYVGWD